MPSFSSMPSPFPLVQDSIASSSTSSLEEWTQAQDMALLTGVDKLGLGNWTDIAAMALQSKRTADECEQRFRQLRTALMPASSATTATPIDDNQAEEEERALNAELKARSDAAVGIPGAHLIGYTVLRQDFDHSFNNEFEHQFLQDMTFDAKLERPHVTSSSSAHSGDNNAAAWAEWTELKLQVLRDYQLRLDEREYRKSVVLRRNLLDFTRMQEVRHRMNHPPADVLIGELDYFAKFSSSYDDFLAFRARILHERRLRTELAELKHLASLGVATVDQAQQMKRARLIEVTASTSTPATIPDLGNVALAVGTQNNNHNTCTLFVVHKQE